MSVLNKGMDIKTLSKYLIETTNLTKAERTRIYQMLGLITTTNGQTVANLGCTASLKTMTKAIGKMTVAWMSSPLGMATIAAAAIFVLYKVIKNYSEAAREAAEANDEMAQKSRDKVAELQEESKTLTELIARYKELASSDIQDSETREEIRTVQEDITDLVGMQAKNLDLVNGKLDDEIAKLDEIVKRQAQTTLDTATANYHNARKAASSAMGDASLLLHDGLIYQGDIEDEILQALIDAGYKEKTAWTDVTHGLFYDSYVDIPALRGFDGNWSIENFDGTIDEKIDYLNGLIDTIKYVEGYASTDIYSALVTTRDAFQQYADNQTNAAIDLLESLTVVRSYDTELQSIVVDSAAAFQQYRDTLIKNIKDDGALSEALASGDIAESDITKYVDAYLSTLPKFTQYYNTTSEAIDGATNSWDGYISAIQELLAGEGGVEAISNEITTLTEALDKLGDGTLGVEDVVKLIEQFPELAPYVDYTAENFGNLESGIKAVLRSSPDKLINTLLEFKEVKNLTGEAAEQVDALIDILRDMPTSGVSDVAEEFGVLKKAIDDATEAQNELEAALAEDDWDAGYEGRVKAFEGFQESYDAGEYGSKAFAAYKEYFGLMEKSPAQIKEWMDANKKYFTEGTDGVLAFLQTVESMSGPGGALDGIASFDADTGEFWYDINELSAFADQLGWTEEMLQDFIYKYRMYCDAWESRSPADSMKELQNAGLFSTEYADFGPTIASLQDLMEYTGLSEQGVYDLIDSINELRKQDGLPEISLIGRDITEVTQESITKWQNLGATAEEVTNLIIDLAEQGVKIKPNLWIDTTEGPQLDVDTILAEAGIEDSETVHVEVDFTVNGEAAMATVEATVAEVKAILGEDWEVKLAANSVDAETGLTAVQTLLNELPPSTDVLLLDETGLARSSLSKVISLLDTIENNNTKTVTIRYKTIGLPMFADGTKRAKAGPALLGDEYSPSGSPKPELVVSGDRAYIAGENGPEVGYLHDGDVVYTADETKRILGMSSLHGSIPAHAGGTAGGLINTGGLSGGNYNFTGGSNNSSSNSGDDEESWFERQYKDHNHWLEMDKESVADYLEWLNGAYQQAYAEGIIDLDEYYKYQEEVYKGVQDLFKDHLNDIDHEMSLLEGAVGSSDEVIALAVQAMADIEKELAAARAAGLDENGDYIQWLEQQWANYSETVIDLREQAETEAKNSVDDLVEYRIKMLKQEIENEKDALDKKLSDLQEFYDKQRKMLQDQYDEEKYLEEQSEKRKSVTDIQSELAMLANDNSAWAQKRKLELQEELSSAEKELSDFERDHALDTTLSVLDEQQAAQEAQIQAEMDALDAKLNDPHALFNQALTDIKNNTADLYQQFIEYNRKYGTGNDQDIADMWEEAYKADLEYQDTHDGQHKDGIEIGNYTGYVVPEKPKPPEPDPTPTPPTDPAPSQPSAPQLTDDIKKKVAAAIWNGGYGWGTGSTRTSRLTEVFGANNGIQALVNKGVGKSGVSLTNEYTYANMRKKFKGYASGTANATPGWHELFEGDIDEYVFTSSDGSKYRMFSGLGDKVLNGDATDFLYDFANSGGTVLTKMLADLLKVGGLGNIAKPVQAIEVSTGDIIIQGSCDEKTVSEIRRAQRDNLQFILKSLNSLNK